jgi:hypothetical protein
MKNRVSQPTAAGKLTDRRSPRRLLRSWTLAPLLVLVALSVAATPALAGEGLGVIRTIGGPGSGPSEFSLAAWAGIDGKSFGSGVAINKEGDIYVADTNNNRIEWFDSAGKYEGQFNGREIDGVPAGKGKEMPSKLLRPQGIAIDDDEASPSYRDVYVLNNDSQVVDKFSATGEFVYQLPTSGTFGGIAIDPSGHVWVATTGNAQFEEFSNESENKLEGIPTKEGGDVQALAVTSKDNLYTIWGGEVRYVEKDGTFTGFVCTSSCAEGIAIDTATNDLFVNKGTSVAQYAPFTEPLEAPIYTSKPNILVSGAGIAVNPTSHEVYVADAGSDEVDVLTLGPAPATPETLPPSEVKNKSAIFRGKLEPASTKLEYYFEYNTGPSCVGGSKTPVKEGEGTVEEEVAGLGPGAEYTYCIVVSNAFGSNSGSSTLPFSTPPAAPEVISESASSTAAGERTLTAEIGPNGEETKYFFEYSYEAGTNGKGELELEGAIKPTGEATLPAAGFGDQTASVGGVETSNLKSLYYRVVAKNEKGGTTTGKVQVYTRLPLIENEITANLTSISTTLQATINPLFQEDPTTYQFEYATSAAWLGTSQATVVGRGEIRPTEPVSQQFPVSVVVGSLQPGETYYYRVSAVNSVTTNANKGHPADGEIEHFTTYAAPAATTGEAGAITGTSATLSGEVDPKGYETSYSFQYISEVGYQAALAKGDTNPYAEGETTAPVSAGSGEATEMVGPIPAGDLLPGETYHYRLVATNKSGVQGIGGERTFTTGSASPPLVSTGGASGVSQNSATLSGTVTTNGLQTNYGFEIGTAPNTYGPATGLGAIGGAATEEVHVTLGELQPGTTYYYRVTATNADGTEKGEPVSFTTPGFPTLLAATPSPPLIASPSIAFPKEEKPSGTSTRTLTNKQKLAKALKACHRDHNKARRQKCEKGARAKYGPARRKARKLGA